jgi:hypothetical protein
MAKDVRLSKAMGALVNRNNKNHVYSPISYPRLHEFKAAHKE